MTTLWLATNNVFGSKVLVVADNQHETIKLAGRITGYFLNWTVEPFVVKTLGDQDDGIETIESWWCNYTDYADGNEKISDAEFEAILRCMKSAFAAVYEAGSDCEGY